MEEWWETGWGVCVCVCVCVCVRLSCVRLFGRMMGIRGVCVCVCYLLSCV